MKNLKSLSVKLFSISLVVFITLFFLSECSKTDKEEQPIVKETGEVEFRAKITLVKGEVEVIRNGRTEPAKIGMILNKGAQLKTGKGSVDLKIAGLGIFKLKPDSELNLAMLSDQTRFRLKEGKILLVLKKLKKGSYCTSFIVETPTAVVGVRGTSFLVSADSKSTKVGVLTGKVNVTSGEKSIEVDELKQVSISETEIEKVLKMDVNTIVDVREILKIKEINTMDEFEKIKLNVKKLEIIESEQEGSEADLKGLDTSIKAKDVEDRGTTTTESIKKKSRTLKSDKTLESGDKEFVDDGEF